MKIWTASIGKLTVTLLLAFLLACATSAPESTQLVASTVTPATDGNANAASVEPRDIEVKEIPIAQNVGTQNELICRTERVTGSHFPVRVCQTRAQMLTAQEGARDFLSGLPGILRRPLAAFEPPPLSCYP